MLKENKKVIGWIMTDIKGLSPSIIQHRIYLIEEAKPKREAILIEILKMLDSEIINPYPIVNG